MDLTVAGTDDAITMVEAQGQEVDDATMVRAFEFAHKVIRELIAAQTDFITVYSSVHSLPEVILSVKAIDQSLFERVDHYITNEKIENLYHVGKTEFHDRLVMLETEVKIALGYTGDSEAMNAREIEDIVYSVVKKHMRKNILEKGLRLDGRKADQVRPVRGTFGILPRVHGSALFQRGITQSLSIATLGGPGDIQIVDDMFEETTKRYIHHYNFPPFSVGEVRPLRGV